MLLILHIIHTYMLHTVHAISFILYKLLCTYTTLCTTYTTHTTHHTLRALHTYCIPSALALAAPPSYDTPYPDINNLLIGSDSPNPLFCCRHAAVSLIDCILHQSARQQITTRALRCHRPVVIVVVFTLAPDHLTSFMNTHPHQYSPLVLRTTW